MRASAASERPADVSSAAAIASSGGANGARSDGMSRAELSARAGAIVLNLRTDATLSQMVIQNVRFSRLENSGGRQVRWAVSLTVANEHARIGPCLPFTVSCSLLGHGRVPQHRRSRTERAR